jgi:Polysaccharide deacetylase
MKHLICILILFCLLAASSQSGQSVAWSRKPPGGLDPKQVPQFVSVTFDDNFGSAFPNATGGIDSILQFYKDKKNPQGRGNQENFDGLPIHATFYYTSIYVVDDSRKVLANKPGEDHHGLNRKAWTAAFQGGNEAGDHTVNHFNGGVVPLDPDDCCRARNWNAAQWAEEIKACKDALTGRDGIGAKDADVIGFRAPYLGYNDSMLTALSNLHFAYDTSLPNCFDDAEDGTNCSWPYMLNAGSPDIDAMTRKFSTPQAKILVPFPKVTAHAGLWELPPTTLIIPPDAVAVKYGFQLGLRAKIAKKGTLPYPSIYETGSGKIPGLDYTLLMDAGLTGAEMSAVLKYNLDLHLSGNRSPFIFIAHSHLYSYSSAKDNPDTPSVADRDARWKGITDFLNYALSKPEVRVVAAKDLLAWLQRHGTAR